MMAQAIKRAALVFEATADFFFPKTCVLCSKYGQVICKRCEEDLPLSRLRCIVCSRANFIGKTCIACANKFTPERVVCLYAYKDTAKNLVKQFKYDDVTSLKTFFSVNLAKQIKHISHYRDYTFVPIPLAYSRRRFRGYNQSSLLARELSQYLKIPRLEALSRVDAGQSQALSQSKEQRRCNIKGAFKATSQVPEKILLIDDVITSGATMLEASKVLKKAGASKIICCSLAM